MTGCKYLDNIKKSLEILFDKLSVTKVILNKNMEYIEKPFVLDTTLLNINNVNNFYIQMINTNFNIRFHINRSKLFQLLLDNNIDASFDPIIHACVNIKYNLNSLRFNFDSISPIAHIHSMNHVCLEAFVCRIGNLPHL
jgi:hypothetical protein